MAYKNWMVGDLLNLENAPLQHLKKQLSKVFSMTWIYLGYLV